MIPESYKISTFAWFSASSTQSLTTIASENALSVDETGTIADIAVPVKYTLTVQGDAPEHTDGSGNVNYYFNGGIQPSSNGSAKKVGTFYLSAQFKYANQESPTAAELAKVATLNGKTFKIEVTGATTGNAKVLYDDNATHVADGNSNHVYIFAKVTGTTITLSNKQSVKSGVGDYAETPTALGAGNTLYYAIRTNNEYGLEVTSSNTAAIENKTYVAGDVVREGSGPYTYWVCKEGYARSSGAASSDGTHWQQAFLHADDKVTLGTGSEVTNAYAG